jgi:probable HAF family extracellular repeat protein
MHLVLLGFALAALGRFARASSGDFTTITVPNSTRTEANGINNRSQIVGFFTDTGQSVHGFLLSGGFGTRVGDGSEIAENGDAGRFARFDVPNSQLTTGNGLNGRGEIVGVYVDLNGNSHGFLLKRLGRDDDAENDGPMLHGMFTTIDAPNSTSTTPNGINNRAQVVGFFGDPLFHGFLLLLPSTFTTIDVPNSTATEANGINNRGETVGSFSDANSQTHGFLLAGFTAFTTVDVPNSIQTVARGINNRGDIVGFFIDANFREHGFLMPRRGCFLTIDVPGSPTTHANGINDHGEIVGIYVNPAGRTVGFLTSAFTASRCL